MVHGDKLDCLTRLSELIDELVSDVDALSNLPEVGDSLWADLNNLITFSVLPVLEHVGVLSLVVGIRYEGLGGQLGEPFVRRFSQRLGEFVSGR